MASVHVDEHNDETIDDLVNAFARQQRQRMRTLYLNLAIFWRDIHIAARVRAVASALRNAPASCLKKEHHFFYIYR
jgi:hypothetical protein